MVIMELTREEVLQQIAAAEEAYTHQHNHQLESHIVVIQENFDVLGEQDQAIYIRFYRLYMRFLTLFDNRGSSSKPFNTDVLCVAEAKSSSAVAATSCSALHNSSKYSCSISHNRKRTSVAPG